MNATTGGSTSNVPTTFARFIDTERSFLFAGPLFFSLGVTSVGPFTFRLF